MAKLSVELNRYFFAEARAEKVTLADILNLTEERIFGFLLAILSLPSALPVPAPGYSIPFGIAIFFLAIQLIIGRDCPWLPEKMLKGSMKLETVQKFVKMGTPWIRKNRKYYQTKNPLSLYQFARTGYPGCGDRPDGYFDDDSHSWD